MRVSPVTALTSLFLVLLALVALVEVTIRETVTDSLPGLRPGDLTFLSVPLDRYAGIDGQGVVLVDRGASRQLFSAAGADELEQHVAEQDESILPPSEQVR